MNMIKDEKKKKEIDLLRECKEYLFRFINDIFIDEGVNYRLPENIEELLSYNLPDYTDSGYLKSKPAPDFYFRFPNVNFDISLELKELYPPDSQGVKGNKAINELLKKGIIKEEEYIDVGRGKDLAPLKLCELETRYTDHHRVVNIINKINILFGNITRGFSIIPSILGDRFVKEFIERLITSKEEIQEEIMKKMLQEEEERIRKYFEELRRKKNSFAFSQNLIINQHVLPVVRMYANKIFSEISNDKDIIKDENNREFIKRNYYVSVSLENSSKSESEKEYCFLNFIDFVICIYPMFRSGEDEFNLIKKDLDIFIQRSIEKFKSVNESFPNRPIRHILLVPIHSFFSSISEPLEKCLANRSDVKRFEIFQYHNGARWILFMEILTDTGVDTEKKLQKM